MVTAASRYFKEFVVALLTIAGTLLAIVDSARILPTVFLHRLVVAVREVSGMRPFEPLSRCPRHVCLVIGRPSRVADVEKAIQALITAGVERVTLSHNGSLTLCEETYTERVTSDMGRTHLVESIRSSVNADVEPSQPDAILLLAAQPGFLHFASNTVQLPSCADASLLYYSELMPVYSLNPSDVLLAVSSYSYQSKSQRFGR